MDLHKRVRLRAGLANLQQQQQTKQDFKFTETRTTLDMDEKIDFGCKSLGVEGRGDLFNLTILHQLKIEIHNLSKNSYVLAAQ